MHGKAWVFVSGGLVQNDWATYLGEIATYATWSLRSSSYAVFLQMPTQPSSTRFCGKDHPSAEMLWVREALVTYIFNSISVSESIAYALSSLSSCVWEGVQ